jgi:hypothetical protein
LPFEYRVGRRPFEELELIAAQPFPLKSAITRAAEDDYAIRHARAVNMSPPLLESRYDGRANRSVHTLKPATDHSHPGNAHHRNQSAD